MQITPDTHKPFIAPNFSKLAQTREWASKLDLDLYEVGGCVRDELLGKTPKDIDYLAAGASIEDIENEVYKTGAITAPLKSNDRTVGVRCTVAGIGLIEICPPRVERSTGPGHNDFDIVCDPEAFVSDDLKRRDFTCNAIARRVSDGTIIDPLNGRKDISLRTLRAVSPDSFRDDPLRIMRGYVRVAVDGFVPDDLTLRMMNANAPGMVTLSGERVGWELRKVLEAKDAENLKRGLYLMRDTGAFEYAIPELQKIVGFQQFSKHHDWPICQHTIEAVGHTAPDDIKVRFAALFHDSGKPDACWTGPDGGQHYYANKEQGIEAHEIIGAVLWRSAAKRMGFNNSLINDVAALIEGHMWYTWLKTNDLRARKFLRRYGYEQSIRLIRLKAADTMGKGPGNEYPEDLRVFEAAVERNRHEPVTVADLDINGDVLVKYAGYKPGPAVGAVLEELLNHVVGDPSLNNRTWLLRMARRSDQLSTC